MYFCASIPCCSVSNVNVKLCSTDVLLFPNSTVHGPNVPMISFICATETFRETPGSQRTFRPMVSLLSLAPAAFRSGSGDCPLLSPSDIDGLLEDLTWTNERGSERASERVSNRGGDLARNRASQPADGPSSFRVQKQPATVPLTAPAYTSPHQYQRTLSDSSP